MRPNPEQIAVAAYQRWQRRGWIHGGDRDDWVAAEKDLTFGMNYRYVARYPLAGPTVHLGKAEAEAARLRRRCRFCERSEPAAPFSTEALAFPPWLGNSALWAWDECDDCRAYAEEHLAAPFEAFARPWLAGAGAPASIPVAAWKALVRMALSVMPAAELHHFDDTTEWVANPDHTRDASLLAGLGCQVYTTAIPVSAPFAALARRVDDDAPWPYMLFFLGASQAVFQTHLPLCPRDEDLEDVGVRGPELSMSLGSGPAHRASVCTFLPVDLPRPASAALGKG